MENRTKISVEKVIIGKFRNLKDKSYSMDSNNIMVKICGNNHIGKTNVINAIMWCLTGVDMQDTSSARNNIPFNDNMENGSIVVDVEVQLSNNHTIRRTITVHGNAISTDIYVDGIVRSVKEGESLIDKVLGLLELSIKYNTSKFNIRRFMLNPLYVCGKAPKEFRQFIVQFVESKVSKESAFNQLSEIEKKQLTEFNRAIDPVVIGSKLKIEKTKLKNEISNKLVVIDYLTNNHSELANEIDNLRNLVMQKEQNLMKLECCEEYNNHFAEILANDYHEVCKNYFNSVEFALIEKNVADNNWNECCKLILPNGIEFSNGSTSEKIASAITLVEGITSVENITTRVPMLVDEWETIDSKTEFNISISSKSQIIATCVKSSSNNEIQIK